jgi:hypothetical protein
VDYDELVRPNVEAGVYSKPLQYTIESHSVESTVIRLWQPANEATTLRVHYERQTAQGAFIAGSDHWLLTNGWDLMLAKAMKYLAPIVREPALLQMYSQLEKDAQKDLVLVLQDFEEDGRDNLRDPVDLVADTGIPVVIGDFES